MDNEHFKYHQMPDTLSELIDQRLNEKENAFKSGCLGALADAIRICEQNERPLPLWVSVEAVKALFALALDDKQHTKKWKHWLIRYRRDMNDIDIYYLIKEAREHGAEWKDVYAIAASIDSNIIDEKRTEAVRKAYKRTAKRLKTEPYRYHHLSTFKKRDSSSPPTKRSVNLWRWVWDNIKSGNPRKTDKSNLG